MCAEPAIPLHFAPRRACAHSNAPQTSHPNSQIAANDEICKAFAEAGGVSALQQLLTTAATATTTDSSATNGPSPELVRGAAAALRQLANSDSIKAQLAEQGVLPVLLR